LDSPQTLRQMILKADGAAGLGERLQQQDPPGSGNPR
jgi:hypothetical protein